MFIVLYLIILYKLKRWKKYEMKIVINTMNDDKKCY